MLRDTRGDGSEARVMIVGIGNDLVADDGVGLHAVRALRRTVTDPRVRCAESERGGLDLLELLNGADAAVIIDAARTGKRPPGCISTFALQKPFTPGTVPSLHALSIDAVLSLGAAAGAPLPGEVILFTVEAEDIESFGAGCTDRVGAAIPRVVTLVQDELRLLLPDPPCRAELAEERNTMQTPEA